MITSIPESWTYSDSLQNLFLFYQASEEMLSFASPDSYRLTVHNTLTLCYEAKRVYSILKTSNQIDRYYSKYLPVIVDELICSIHEDKIIKPCLGQRLDSIISGLTTAKANPSVLTRWINLIIQSCTLNKYTNFYKNRIICLVKSGKDKKELISCINKYFVSLVNSGYNMEYLYQSLIRFFDNRYNGINSSDVIEPFLNKFDFIDQDVELFLVANTYLIDSFTDNHPNLKSFVDTKKLNEEDVRGETSKSRALQVFYENYLKAKAHDNISMIAYKSKSLDPYSALKEIEGYFGLLQILNGYFKHQSEHKMYFDVLQKDESRFIPIKLRRTIPNRPHTEQSLIDSRIAKILENDSLSHAATNSLLSALDMHLDAINCKSEDTMLRTFWTAVEALFFDTITEGERENAVYSLFYIIEKTYLLKVLRTVYSQLKTAVNNEEPLKTIGIDSFCGFLEFFSSFEADSNDFKKLYALIPYNPLLRSRIYNFRKELADGKHIRDKLLAHNNKVLWQIHRIYRTRNLSTHTGINMSYMEDVLFNLHNYFDYVINYIICKIENDDYINSISSLVFEAKNDNQIHMEYLKNNELLSKNNYRYLLFGPDDRMIAYDYEVTV